VRRRAGRCGLVTRKRRLRRPLPAQAKKKEQLVAGTDAHGGTAAQTPQEDAKQPAALIGEAAADEENHPNGKVAAPDLAASDLQIDEEPEAQNVSGKDVGGNQAEETPQEKAPEGKEAQKDGAQAAAQEDKSGQPDAEAQQRPQPENSEEDELSMGDTDEDEEEDTQKGSKVQHQAAVALWH
jgi:hypothetical protein